MRNKFAFWKFKMENEPQIFALATEHTENSGQLSHGYPPPRSESRASCAGTGAASTSFAGMTGSGNRQSVNRIGIRSLVCEPGLRKDLQVEDVDDAVGLGRYVTVRIPIRAVSYREPCVS